VFALCGLVVAVATGAAVASSDGWPERLPLHLALFVVAGLAWAAALALLPRIARGRRDLAVLVGVALLLRLPAWLRPPAHSDDVYRYAWDGRVAHAGGNPYRYAPADDALAPLRGDGTLWSRINHRELPTVYPPGAQLFFAVAARLPLAPVASLKLLLAACDLGVLALLVALLRRRGADPRAAAAWGWSPLVAIEVGQNAHLDALPILCIVAALLALGSGRRALAGLLLGAATGAKLVAAPLLVATRSARAWAAALGVALLVALPYLGAGAALVGSTGEFARRWRGNDGVHALIQAATDRIVCRALAAPTVPREGTPCDRPLDLWPHHRLAALVSGRGERDAVYPDEISGAASRALVALLLGGVLLAVARRRPPPALAMEWILGALVLLTPVMHPWYALWLLPFAALHRRAAWIALAALAPLAYAPMADWLRGAPWRDPLWTRLVEHGACWALLLAAALRRQRERARVEALESLPAPVTIRAPQP
jgi:hypothetical protein